MTWTEAAADRARLRIREVPSVSLLLGVCVSLRPGTVTGLEAALRLGVEGSRRHLHRRRVVLQCTRLCAYPLLFSIALLLGLAVGRLDTHRPPVREIAPTSQPVGRPGPVALPPDIRRLLMQ